jgi:hypothetical protein
MFTIGVRQAEKDRFLTDAAFLPNLASIIAGLTQSLVSSRAERGERLG